MSNFILSAEQVREIVERAGVGESFTQKVENIARRLPCGQRTIYNYLKDGSKPGAVNELLCRLSEGPPANQRSLVFTVPIPLDAPAPMVAALMQSRIADLFTREELPTLRDEVRVLIVGGPPLDESATTA